VSFALLVLAVLAVSVGSGFAVGARDRDHGDWTATRLPGLASRDGFAWAAAINNRGQIVGAAAVRGGWVHAVLWQRGKPRDLGTLGGKNSWAYDINDRGRVVGRSDTRGADDRAHAFLWENGRMRDLGTLPGRHPDSEAAAINEHGQIVGRTNSTSSGASHAWLWEKGKMRDLGRVLAGSESDATDINEHGQVVGWAGDREVFLYEHGRVRKLGIRSNYGDASINDKGVIVTDRPSVVWRAGHAARLCKGRDCDASAINNRGHVVGELWVAAHESRPFFYENGKLTTLPKSGWTYGDASDVNDADQIVGSTSPLTGVESAAWLWTRDT
jgi:probable HAF family extracellular repeat protein